MNALKDKLPPLGTLGPVIALLMACAFFATQSDRFLTGQNLSLVLQQVMVVGVIAIGQTLIILTAGIDLSCGMVMALGSVVMTKFATELGMPPALAVLCGIAVTMLFGLANVDAAFVAEAGLEASQIGVFCGVPDPSQLPTASDYVEDYITRYNQQPGVWGTFAYDSLKLWAQDVDRLNTVAYGPVLQALRRTRGYLGQTGTISIDPITGNRLVLPLYILDVNDAGVFVIDQPAAQ